MTTQLTKADSKASLKAHAAGKGVAIREKYGPDIGWNELRLILEDRAFVRYPCEIKFDAGPLLPGEVAHPVAKGEKPEEGFTLCVHPFFMTDLKRVTLIILYQLVLVNYGEFASPEAAEAFGANALGLSVEEYYQAICEMADEIA